MDTSLNFIDILNLIGQLPIAIRQLKTRQTNPQYEYLGSPQRDLFSSLEAYYGHFQQFPFHKLIQKI